jgi:hypothetical protein
MKSNYVTIHETMRLLVSPQCNHDKLIKTTIPCLLFYILLLATSKERTLLLRIGFVLHDSSNFTDEILHFSASPVWFKVDLIIWSFVSDLLRNIQFFIEEFLKTASLPCSLP